MEELNFTSSWIWELQETQIVDGISLNGAVRRLLDSYKNSLVGNNIREIFKEGRYQIDVWCHLPSEMNIITITCIQWPDKIFNYIAGE